MCTQHCVEIYENIDSCLGPGNSIPLGTWDSTLLRRKANAWSSAPFSSQTSAVLCRHTWCFCENLVVYDNLEILIMKAISILPTFFTTLDTKSDFAF